MSAIGDVTHTLPALTALRAHYSKAHIAWLVEEQARDVVSGHRALDRVLIWKRRSAAAAFMQGNRLAPVREMFRLAKEVCDTAYDLVIDFHALLKSSLWVALSRSRRKVGFGPGMEHAEGSYIFLNERIPAISMDVHALDRGLHLIKAVGIPVESVCYDFPITQANQQEAEFLMERSGIRESEPLVIVHPVALWPTKLWETDRFSEVADRLMKMGFQVAFTGGKTDRETIDKICQSLLRKPVRWDGATDLKTLAALFQKATVVLSTDTGPMHIAAAVGTPVVALFGPTAPWRTGPYGNNHHVLRAGLACSPCFRRKCLTGHYEEMACMRRITVQQVVDAIEDKINSRFGRHNHISYC